AVHFVVHISDLFAGDEAAADARLVAGDEEEKTPGLEFFEGGGDAGEDFDEAGIAEIGDVANDGVVPVEEDGARFHNNLCADAKGIKAVGSALLCASRTRIAELSGLP